MRGSQSRAFVCMKQAIEPFLTPVSPPPSSIQSLARVTAELTSPPPNRCLESERVPALLANVDVSADRIFAHASLPWSHVHALTRH